MTLQLNQTKASAMQLFWYELIITELASDLEIT
jgi:hypothetical protein